MHLLIAYGLGAATVAVAKTAGDRIGRAARPIARETIKGGLRLGRELQRAAEEAGASLGDLAAEAREELDGAEPAATTGNGKS